VGFAIPIEMARKIGDELILRGQIERGWLGVSIQSVTPELASTFHAEEWAGGVLINRVEAAAPAQKAGILRGDIIIQFNGKTVLGSKKFQIMVANTKIGEMVPVTVLRDGVKKIIRVEIGEYIS
jgi:serine protease Do